MNAMNPLMNNPSKTLNCPLCHQTGHFYVAFRQLDYYQCHTCSGVFMNPQHYVSLEAEKARYEEHNNDTSDLRYQGFVRPLVDAIMRDYPTTSTGLDYGCGTGPVISKLLTDEAYTVYLYDPFFQPIKENLNRTYDYIVACEVIEHFHTPDREFQRLKDLLHEKGRLYLKTSLMDEVPSFLDWRYKNDPTHVFFYHSKTLDWIKKTYHFKHLKVHFDHIVLTQ
jgi:SAM-dependent methyltransferase